MTKNTWPSSLVGPVDRHDVRVRQLGRGARLAQEPLANGRIGGQVGRKRLDGDGTVELEVARQVDDAHPAATDLAFERVLALEEPARRSRVLPLASSRKIRIRRVGGFAKARAPGKMPRFAAAREAVRLDAYRPSPCRISIARSSPWPRKPCRRRLRRMTRSRSTAPTTSSSMSATPSRRRSIYRAAFGFQLVAYRGPETGVARPRELPAAAGQDPLRADVARSGPRARSPTTSHEHGDGVRDLALWVDDARDAYAKAVERGAVPVREPDVLQRRRTARSSSRPSGPTATPSTRSSSAGTTAGSFLPGFAAVEPVFQAQAGRASSTWTTASATSSSAR